MVAALAVRAIPLAQDAPIQTVIKLEHHFFREGSDIFYVMQSTDFYGKSHFYAWGESHLEKNYYECEEIEHPNTLPLSPEEVCAHVNSIRSSYAN